jgi:hypothetical protein
MKGYQHCGKQVFDTDGVHFADAVSPLAALLIVAALNFRNHRPVIDGEAVVCSRCRSALPHEGGEPCVPKTPRCKQTLDMFGDEGGSNDTAIPEAPVRAVRPRGTRRDRRKANV